MDTSTLSPTLRPTAVPERAAAPDAEALRRRIEATPIDALDPSDPDLFETDTVEHAFARLRREDPVHRSRSPHFGEFWSVTRYQDIMAVDTNHAAFSSSWELGGINIADRPAAFRRPSFIAMDPPRHDQQRMGVSPIVAPTNLARLESLIRERTGRVLDGLPRGETFDWVEHVSIELTTLMLATLFDFPLEERRSLTWWSDVATSVPEVDGKVASEAARIEILGQMAERFTALWNERVNADPRPDLISMLAHSPATRHMPRDEFMGNLGLLIVGGNDTTRNSMTGGLLALAQHPDEWAKLRANPALVDSLVSEIIRWQTPLAHMRRTATRDIELVGRQIREGDKVVMWYLSGNRDETAIERPHTFRIDRARPRQHLSFGFGIHRCVGNRLAELQLKILWQEILARFPTIELAGEPVRVRSSFVRGFSSLPVRIPA
jgi:cytochrome P450